MSKFTNNTIFLISITLWMTGTIAASYYSYSYYKMTLARNVEGVVRRINNNVNVYKDLADDLAVFFESSSNVDHKEMDSFYKNWERNHLANSMAVKINFYGWYSPDAQKINNFYTIVNKADFSDLAITPSITDKAREGNEAPRIDLSIKNPPDSIMITRAYKNTLHDGRAGYVFLSIDKKIFLQFIREAFKQDNRDLQLFLSWNHAPVNGHELFLQNIPIGGDQLNITLAPVYPWNFLGRGNFIGILVGAMGFLVVLLLAFYLKAVYVRSVTSDLAREDAEKKLLSHALFFEKFLENLPGILFIKDVRDDYKYYMFNKEAEIFFGYKRDEMIGKSDSDFFKEDEAAFFRSIDEATMQGKKVINIPCESVTTSSGEAFLHTRKVPIYDTDGNPVFLIGLSQDITTRKKNDMELAEYRKNLEHMVEERTQKLNMAMIKAEEANRLKSEFLATMSHEIRSPMSGVLGMAELLLDSPLSPEQKNLTKTILNSGEVLMNIIEDILDFSKIEANKLELDPVATNILELVDDVCTLYSSRAREKALELAVRYVPGSEQYVYTDPLRLRQILGNLLGNAIKFTPKGHIVLTVEEDKIAALLDDKVSLIFTVEDTGIGIAEKDRERIFEKFSQANSSTTRDYGGTGLGLSISKKLIELMGGKIALTSEIGAGSKFTFNLPMPRNREEVFVQPQPPVLKNKRILIVDDLPVIRTLLVEQMEMAGLICDSVSSGHEALQKLEQAKSGSIQYDMMIIDYLMPEMNGEMLARAINDDPDLRNICLIMLTAAGNPVLNDNFAEKGFSAYISKPVRALRLVETLAIIWTKYDGGQKDTLIRIDTTSLGHTPSAEEEDFKLEGYKILLVEDSRLNQAFVEEVLSQLACDTTTVSNGQEALNIITQERFDLVLMDCQMPVMDGFEASRRIVALKKEGILSEKMPVLALTANAMKGDRQRCFDAGMDDYISKPVRKRELKDKIHYWIMRDKPSGTAEASPPPKEPSQDHAPEDTEILNLAAFHEARAILKDKFDFLLGCYIEDVESYLAEIRGAFALQDVEAMVRPAHTIKSTSKRMGAFYLSHLAKIIEHTARELPAGDIPAAQAKELADTVALMVSVFEQTKSSLLLAAGAQAQSLQVP